MHFPKRYVRWREPFVFCLFLAGAAIFTFPLARDLRTAVTDHADPLLDAWALSWVAHELPRDPVHLFDANRFYPEKGTLAFSDPMIGLGVLVAPIWWIFGDALVTLNLAMLLSIALSGYGAYRLGAHVSGSRWAGGVAGSVFAFNAYRLSHLSHIQLQTSGFIPLLYLAIARYLEEGQRRHAVGIAVFLWFVAASCAYYGMFTWVLFAVAIPYEIWRTSAYKRPRRLVGLALALAVSALAYLPLALPFMRLEKDFGLNRPPARLQRASARPADYLRSGAHVHRSMGMKRPSAERTLFPGIVAVGLGLCALARPRRTTGLYLLLGAVAAWASLGPAWGLYRFLHAVVPGLSGVRVPPRIAIYVLLAFAVLAASGAALVLRHARGRIGIFLSSALVALPLAESFGGPIPYARAPSIPGVYGWLSSLDGTVPVVEMPLPEVKRQRENAVYLYWSTTHFQPIANGYGTVVPPVYAEIASIMRSFPSPEGVDALRRLGFLYVIFHKDRYLRPRAERLERRLNGEPGLLAVYATANEVVYELPRQVDDLNRQRRQGANK